jgi:hypothetical protein
MDPCSTYIRIEHLIVVDSRKWYPWVFGASDIVASHLANEERLYIELTYLRVQISTEVKGRLGGVPQPLKKPPRRAPLSKRGMIFFLSFLVMGHLLFCGGAV